MNRFLLYTFLSGIVIVIIVGFGRPVNNSIGSMFFSLVFTTLVFLLFYIKLYEKPKKESDLDSSDKLAIKALKIWCPILILIGSLYYIGNFIEGIIERADQGTPLFTNFTFWLGIMVIAVMLIVILIGIIKKKNIFSSDNIRMYAYVYLNLLLSMMLILR